MQFHRTFVGGIDRGRDLREGHAIGRIGALDRGSDKTTLADIGGTRAIGVQLNAAVQHLAVGGCG